MPLYSYKGIAPKLGRDVFIAPNATIIGDVEIGDESSVWFGAVIRGDVMPIRIGARSNIQDNAVVHVTRGRSSTTIGDDVTVGHLALLHGCTVGNRCLVGMGSIVLDDVVIEDECLIGAGSLLTPGSIVPTRSLFMGRPARKARTLDDADVRTILGFGADYVSYSRDFRDVKPV